MSASLTRPIPEASHEPFPIADLDSGMYTAKEPWLSPQNAFTDITDGYTFRSRLRRRRGFDRFAQCGVTATASVGETNLTTAVRYILGNTATRLVGESCRFTWNDPVNGTINAECDEDSWGFQTFGSINAYGWAVTETGTSTVIGWVLQAHTNAVGTAVPATAQVNWPLHSDHTGNDAALGAMTYATDASLPIVGLRAYRDTAGEEYLVAANTTRFFLYDSADGYFKDSIGSDVFTGTESDLFWMWPAGDILVVTNGVDVIKKYTGSTDTLANMTTTIGAGPSTVSAARIAILFRNRIIYMNNVEGGTSFPLRARWSRAGAYETLDTADSVDAPSELGTIVTAGFIAERLFVGFENGWMELVYTGDSRELFRFDKTTYVRGSNAKLGTVPDGQRLLSRTPSGIEAIDPNSQYKADIAIPDYVINRLSTNDADFTYGFRNLPNRQIWWSVVNTVSEDETPRPNEIVVAQYQEDERFRWSRFGVGFNCFTEFRSQSTPTWDDIDANWDDYGFNWDSSAGIAGFPVTLCGHNDGTIYVEGASLDKINDSPIIDPVSIEFSATSSRLTPYPGMKSHLGWVDFYLDASEDATLEVQFRGDTNQAAYKVVTFSLSPSGANEKIYRRVKVNKTASFHRMTIVASGGGSFAVDAIIPWFRKTGRLRNFG